MLRTMITETEFEQRWVLQGRLAGGYALDLKQRWEEACRTRRWRSCIVDLEDVTSVDHDGEGLLRQMAADGAQFVANRAYMKHLLDDLAERVSIRNVDR
jgi:anti-anti-sigma regulatory factor